MIDTRMHDYQRPPTLHRYAARTELEAALRGQFRLVPAGGFLTLSFSTEWDKRLFDVFKPADSCLVIHNTEEFGERLHRAVQRTLPNWAGAGEHHRSLSRDRSTGQKFRYGSGGGGIAAIAIQHD